LIEDDEEGNRMGGKRRVGNGKGGKGREEKRIEQKRKELAPTLHRGCSGRCIPRCEDVFAG
jgi:hypothetical protein